MSNVKGIEDAISRLSPDELAVFRTWFARFDAEAWDRQLEQDVAAGKLDALSDLHGLVAGQSQSSTEQIDEVLFRHSPATPR